MFSRTVARSYSAAASGYSAPLAQGVLPAYDQAIRFLAKDRETKLAALDADTTLDAAAREAKEIDAWVNDPETRWKAKNGQGDLTKPVYRHLAERAWRKEGPLAILNQRVQQMSVVPDLLPTILPVVDLRITIAGAEIEPGQYVLPSQTIESLQLQANVYHREEQLYTLIMVDPDVPDEENRSYKTFAHWMIPNITLSSTQSSITSPALLPYIPPHPQKGTPYHRYTLLLLAHPIDPATGKSSPIEIAAESIERDGVDVRALMHEHKFVPKGITFFRQVWDSTVTAIYEQHLDVPEPNFGRMPKVNRYIDESGVKPPKYDLEG